MNEPIEIDRIIIENENHDKFEIVFRRTGQRFSTEILFNNSPLKPISFHSSGPALSYWGILKDKLKAPNEKNNS